VSYFGRVLIFEFLISPMVPWDPDFSCRLLTLAVRTPGLKAQGPPQGFLVYVIHASKRQTHVLSERIVMVSDTSHQPGPPPHHSEKTPAVCWSVSLTRRLTIQGCLNW